MLRIFLLETKQFRKVTGKRDLLAYPFATREKANHVSIYSNGSKADLRMT